MCNSRRCVPSVQVCYHQISTAANRSPISRKDMPRILMTGASGGIGTRLRKLLPPVYPDLLLSDIRSPADLVRNEQFKAADLSDMAEGGGILAGVDGVL